MSSLLVTGCCGYLGKEICNAFRIAGWQVFGIDRTSAPPQLTAILADVYQGDVLTWEPPWNNIDAIVHLAGASRIVDDYPDSYYYRNNIQTTKHMKEVYPDVPLYYASSTAMYDESGNNKHIHPYTSSKEEAEQYANVVFRTGTVMGSNWDGDYHGMVDLMLDSVYQKGILICAAATEDSSYHRPYQSSI